VIEAEAALDEHPQAEMPGCRGSQTGRDTLETT
jgi:hypothetical protein